ncbi:unnamed protein product [Caretta caretta]
MLQPGLRDQGGDRARSYRHAGRTCSWGPVPRASASRGSWQGSRAPRPAVPEGHELFSTSGDPKEQPHILGTSALVEDSAVPRRALLKEAHHQEKAKGCSLL